MIYTQTILDDILIDGQCGLSLPEVAARLGLSSNEFYLDFHNPELNVQKYYNSGVMQGKVETDNQLFQLAKNGSLSAKEFYDHKKVEAKLTNVFHEIINS